MPNKWCTGHNQQWFHSSIGSRSQQRCRIWLQSIPASASPTFYDVSFMCTIEYMNKVETKQSFLYQYVYFLFLSAEKVIPWNIHEISYFLKKYEFDKKKVVFVTDFSKCSRAEHKVGLFSFNNVGEELSQCIKSSFLFIYSVFSKFFFSHSKLHISNIYETGVVGNPNVVIWKS